MTTTRNAIVEYSQTTGQPTGLAWVDGEPFNGVSTEAGGLPVHGVQGTISTKDYAALRVITGDVLPKTSGNTMTVDVINNNQLKSNTSATWTHV